MVGTIIASGSDIISVRIILIRINYIDTIITYIANPIIVCIFLTFKVCFGAVVTQITKTIIIRIDLVRI